MHIVDIEYKNNKTSLKIFILPEIYSTGCFADFSKKVLRAIPSLSAHICINDKKRGFVEELKETELAHAFEHILIEKIGQKDKNLSSLKAWTGWNWHKEGRHIYNVEIEYVNRKIFREALLETLNILNMLSERSIITKKSFDLALDDN